MNERALFIEALEKQTPAERSTFLDEACSGDLALRQRVEALLQSHGEAGGFLEVPVPERLSERIGNAEESGNTQDESSADNHVVEALGFLESSDRPGSLGRLGHYEIQEVIGQGGMGIVLRAFDEKLHRIVAIKVMAAQLATNATARKRFTREAQAAAAVTHDHIVTIHAVEEANGLPYLVMQYVSGVSLQQRLDRSGPLELREIVRIGMQTAVGLAAAHAQGLIHRDIKPANILLENGVERVKITDFGLARAVADVSLTQSGVVAGTPQYMAPEQARGEAVDQRSDLFSVGSVLYAMCAGRPPFRGNTGVAVLKRVCEDTPSPLKEINAEIPAWLAEIVTKLLAKDPADRFQSAAEVGELLKRHLAHLQHPSVVPLPTSPVGKALRGIPSGQRNTTQSVPNKYRQKWAIAAAALLCLTVGLGLAEATGTTQLTATVIRIFTPSGTLIVEVDDPQVQVTIEGDGGLSITGAGAQEVRVRPGKYHVQATKDGKPVATKLVEITRGDRKVVMVGVEPPPKTAAGPAVPKLLTPAPWAVLSNGAFDKTKEHAWEFTWAAVPGASRYHLYVIGPLATIPLINDVTITATSHRLQDNSFVIPQFLVGWRWKVRAMVDGKWSEWSEERTFDIEPPAAVAAKPKSKAFVILASEGKVEQSFATLGDAVVATSDGDTIEIRGNGPFVTDKVGSSRDTTRPVTLTIRAGAGFAPVIQVKPEGLGAGLYSHSGRLVLEGLEIQRVGDSGGKSGSVIWCNGGTLQMAHCRFVISKLDIFQAYDCRLCEVRNCQFLCGPEAHIGSWNAPSDTRLRMENNLLVGARKTGNRPIGMIIGRRDPDVNNVSIQLLGNTIVGQPLFPSYYYVGSSVPPAEVGNPQKPPFEIEAVGNIIDVPTGFVRSIAKPPHADEGVENFLKRVVFWREQGNLYSEQSRFCDPHAYDGVKTFPTPTALLTLANWEQFWELKNTGSSQGSLHFAGGDVHIKLNEKLASLTPADFRLSANSAGKGAGEGGRDLGANVDLVGPGPAYERWKKTPDYQQWLKDTGQLK